MDGIVEFITFILMKSIQDIKNLANQGLKKLSKNLSTLKECLTNLNIETNQLNSVKLYYSLFDIDLMVNVSNFRSFFILFKITNHNLLLKSYSSP